LEICGREALGHIEERQLHAFAGGHNLDLSCRREFCLSRYNRPRDTSSHNVLTSQEAQSCTHSIPQPQKDSAPFSPPRRTKSLSLDHRDHPRPMESVISCDVRPGRKGKEITHLTDHCYTSYCTLLLPPDRSTRLTRVIPPFHWYRECSVVLVSSFMNKPSNLRKSLLC
jgi:hypothetical protein